MVNNWGRTTYSSSSVSWATSGTVMLPETSSPLDVLPVVKRKEKDHVCISLLLIWQLLVCSYPIKRTRELETNFNVEQGDDFSLSLGDINIAFNAQDLVNFSRHIALASREDCKLVVEVFLGPFTSVLVDPVPVVGVVEDHCG